jgi:hypothetical protein
MSLEAPLASQKIAITIPEEQMRILERVHAGLPEEVSGYEEGYRHKPEPDREIESYARAAAEVLISEEWE